MKELTYQPNEIRSMMVDVSELLGEGAVLEELCSYLDTDTLRRFTNHLRTVGEIEEVLTFEETN